MTKDRLYTLTLLLSGWLILPILTVVSYYYSAYEPPLALLLPHVPGVFLYYHLLTQILSGSRVRALDRTFGQPLVIRLHIVSAAMITLMLGLHFAVRLDWNELVTPSTILGLTGGIPVLALMILASTRWARTPLAVGKPGDYSRLRWIHNGMVPLSVILWVHVQFAEAQEFNPLGRGLTTIYLLVALGHYFYHKWHSMSSKAFQGRIVDIERHRAILSISVGELNKPLQFQGGQFGYLRILHPDLPSEEHPFSFSRSCSENKDGFQMTIKAVGDYTGMLMEKARIGMPISLYGPFGKFVIDEKSDNSLLLIAGGVGITPFLSMAEVLAKKKRNKPVNLKWFCSGKEDFFAKAALQGIAKTTPQLNLDFIIDKRGENLSAESMADWIDDDSQCLVYVCAPPPMMKLIIRYARQAGIPRKNIHHEAFSF